MEMPERFAALGVHGFERSRVITEEKQSPCRAHSSRPRTAVAGLDVTPARLIAREPVGQQNFLAVVAFAVTDTRGVVSSAGLGRLWLEEIKVAAFESQEIKHGCFRVEGGGVPVGGSHHTGTDARAFFGRLDSGAPGAAFLVNFRGPIQLFGKTRGGQKFA